MEGGRPRRRTFDGRVGNLAHFAGVAAAPLLEKGNSGTEGPRDAVVSCPE